MIPGQHRRSCTRSALRGFLSVALAWILIVDYAIASPQSPTAPSPPPAARKPALQERIAGIPSGSLVEVRLKTKDRVRGRITDVTSDGFTVKYAVQDRVEERKFEYVDVKSVKQVNSESTREPGTPAPTLQEQVVGIPSGALVVVRLKTKEQIRGRMADISNEGFTVKLADKDKVGERKIAYQEVKSVKRAGNESGGGKVVLYVLAGIGAVFVVAILIWAARGAPVGD